MHLKSVFCSLALLLLCMGRAGSEPLKDPRCLGSATDRLGLDLAGEKGPREALWQVVFVRAGPLRRNAADDYRNGQ